jgi:hypothetical protein
MKINNFGHQKSMQGKRLRWQFMISFVFIIVLALLIAGERSTQAVAPPWPPVADAGGPYSIVWGDDIILDGSGSYDPNPPQYMRFILKWEWDLDNDGVFDDALGAQPTLTQVDYESFWDVGVNDIGLKVTNNVRPPDIDIDFTTVEISPIPIPGAIWLLGSGLIGLVGLRKKLRR